MQPFGTRSRWWVVGAMSAASIVLTIDLFGVNVALPTISRDLHLSDDELQWVPSIYFLLLAAPLVAAGRLGDVLGRRRVLVAGALITAVGSLLAAVAPDAETLLAGRAVSGVGAALVTALSLTIVSQAFPPERRGLGVGIWSAVGAVGAAAGPLVGGIVTDTLGWRWLFALDVPVAVAAVLITLAVVPESRNPDARGVDVGGIALVTLGFGFLSYGLLAGPESSWSDATVLGALVLGVLALVAFAVSQLRRRSPLLDVRWLTRPPALGTGIVAFVGNAAFAVVLLYVTLYLQGAHGEDAIETGLVFLAFTIPLGLGSPFAGAVGRRLRPDRAMVIGLVLLAVGGTVLAFLRRDSSTLLVAAGLVPSGVGQALVFNVTNLAEINSVGAEDAGMAAGVVSGIRQVGSLVGLAAAGAVFALAGGVSQLVGASSGGLAGDFDDGLRAVMVMIVAVCLLGVAATVWARRPATPTGR